MKNLHLIIGALAIIFTTSSAASVCQSKGGIILQQSSTDNWTAFSVASAKGYTLCVISSSEKSTVLFSEEISDYPISMFILWDNDHDLKFISGSADGYVVRIYSITDRLIHKALEQWTRSAPTFGFLNGKPFAILNQPAFDSDPTRLHMVTYLKDGMNYSIISRHVFGK